jgi:hypothetical protein
MYLALIVMELEQMVAKRQLKPVPLVMVAEWLQGPKKVFLE